VTLGAGGQTVTISAVETITGGAGADAVTVTGASVDGGTVTYDGGAASDTLTINGSGSLTLDATELGNITAWENWTFGSNIATSITTAAGNVATSGALTMNFAALTSAAATVNISAETDGLITYTGGNGINDLTVSSTMIDGAAVTLTGGTGTSDTLRLSGDNTTLIDSELVNITAWETWRLNDGGNHDLTLNAANVASAATLSFISSVTGANTATVDATLETDGTINYAGGGGADTLTVASAMLEGAVAVIDGNGSASDTLTFIGTANLNTTELGSIQEFETWVLGSNANYTLVMASINAFVTSGSLTIDATAVLSGSTATIDTQLDTTAPINYTGGAGTDNLTVASAMIDGQTVILNGNAGTDTLTFIGTGTLSAIELGNISNFETWTLASNATYNLTLSTVNAGTGTLTIDATAINVNGSFGTFDASAETDGGSINLSVTTSALDTVAATLTGGAGASDVLSLQSSIVLDATELANVSGFETWTIATDGVYNLTLADGNAGTGTLTINGAAATTSALTINGSGELDAGSSLIITGGGVGDTLTGGAGADTITGNAGADTLTGNGAADTFAYNATGDFGDTITDFIAATDKIQFDISNFLADTNSLLTTGDATATSTDTAGGAAVSFQTVAATGDFTTTAGNEIFILSNAAFNSAANIQTAIQTGGGTVISFSNSVDSGIFLIAYDTGTVARIAAVTISNDFTTSGATVTDVAELTGITDVTTLTTADFSFIA